MSAFTVGRGNIPHLIATFSDFEFLFLTSADDKAAIEQYPSVKYLRRHCQVSFIFIDDILDGFFKAAPSRIYPVALTHAFFRGMKSVGRRRLIPISYSGMGIFSLQMAHLLH